VSSFFKEHWNNTLLSPPTAPAFKGQQTMDNEMTSRHQEKNSSEALKAAAS